MTILDTSASLIVDSQHQATINEGQSAVYVSHLERRIRIFLAFAHTEDGISTGPPGTLANGEPSPDGITGMFALVCK